MQYRSKHHALSRRLIVAGLSLFLLAAEQKPLAKQSFKEILNSYLFINDFYLKEETRKNSDELFWRYDLKIPKVDFQIQFDPENVKEDIPATTGVGREYEHLNRGRALFLEGKYDEAKKVWLTGRQNFGKNYAYHRRNDYFIGQAFLQLGKQELAKNGNDYEALGVKGNLANAATFFSWAFIVKKDNPDPLLDRIAPRYFYNLAAIYFRYLRYAAAYGAADEGLNYLRKTGRNEHRPELRRIMAEGQIQNISYIDAVKELDTAIRQDPNPEQASLMFRRVGDIYFALNNYELAEENYAIANRINSETGSISPAQYVLRAEALFWLGNFKEALNNYRYAISTTGDKQNLSELPKEYTSIANLRIADSLLALKDYEGAKLQYFRVIQEFRGTKEDGVAKVRSACLELPEYDGKNVAHAREVLEASRADQKLTGDAIELAWACEVASYTQRERTDDMVERVRTFAYKYPDSRFLNNLIPPVKEVKASKLGKYFASGNSYAAISYFEQTRKMLFPKVNNDLAKKLFIAYTDAFKSDKAKEFWPAFNHGPLSDIDELRSLAFLSEVAAQDKSPSWKAAVSKKAQALTLRKWTLEPSPLAFNYLQRIKNTSDPDFHIRWNYELAKAWAKTDQKLICGMAYPLLSRQAEILPNENSRLQKDLDNYVAALFPKLLESDENCAISLLELELKLLNNQPAELAARYLNRASWPLTKPLTGLFWEVAELNAAQGKTTGARELWTIIRDKAPKDTAEFSFAKVRLDSSRTEYDGLWR